MTKRQESMSEPKGKKAAGHLRVISGKKVAKAKRSKQADPDTRKGAAGAEIRECSPSEHLKLEPPDGGKLPIPKKSSAKKQVKEAREAVFENLPKIVKGLALKSGDNYLTAKFLFDFAKVEEVSRAAKPGQAGSVSGLLKKLGFADDKGSAATRSKISRSNASKGENT
jgi:hypothetical protein